MRLHGLVFAPGLHLRRQSIGTRRSARFATELRSLVDDMGPDVEVVQKIEVGRGVTGADIGSMLKGPHPSAAGNRRSRPNNRVQG
jgi:hypothetical protein